MTSAIRWKNENRTKDRTRDYIRNHIRLGQSWNAFTVSHQSDSLWKQLFLWRKSQSCGSRPNVSVCTRHVAQCDLTSADRATRSANLSVSIWSHEQRHATYTHPVHGTPHCDRFCRNIYTVFKNGHLLTTSVQRCQCVALKFCQMSETWKNRANFISKYIHLILATFTVM